MLWVGQFGIAGGEARERTPWVGAFPDPSQAEEPSDLYLIVEPALPGSEEFCTELGEAIGSVFHRRKASLTGGLLRALKAAHEDLREWNRKSIKEHRVAAGVSCLALRGQDAYLAQVAPAAAALYHPAAAAAGPAGAQQTSLQSLQPSLPDSVEPLGLHDEFWPQFSRFELVEGDRLLLLSLALARALPAQDLAAALSLPAEEALPALYRQARSLSDCGALLVASLPDAPAPQATGN